jgi:hypothetical protein
VNEFEVLTAMRGTQSFEVLSKRVEVNVVPSSIIPAVVLLNIISVVIVVSVEPNTVIILTRNWDTVDIYRDLLFDAVVERQNCP